MPENLEDKSSENPGASHETDVRKPDVQAILAEIRRRVKEDISSSKEGRHPLKSYAATQNGQSCPAGQLLRSEDLSFLNRHHAYATSPDADGIKTHRKGIIGRVIVKAKQIMARSMRFSMFAGYLMNEAEFCLNLVRFLNDIGRYVDARDAAIFWELIRKIDHDVNGAVERIERISDEQTASLRASEKEQNERLAQYVRELQARVSDLSGKVNELSGLDSTVKGLEGIVGRIGKTHLPDSSQGAAASGPVPDQKYVLFENRFRGSEEEIGKRLSQYVDIFRGAEGKILEIGPGRGELLALMKDAGIDCYGLELDSAMTRASREKGVSVIEGNGLTHLHECRDGSLGGLIAIQVVEHLTVSELQDLLENSARKIRRGGRIVFETVNPQSVLALSSNYFRDPTHKAPLHPDTLSYMMTLSGLKVLEVRKLSPVDQASLLKMVPVQDFMPPRWRETIEVLNQNLTQLNNMLYGCQDYCVIAET